MVNLQMDNYVVSLFIQKKLNRCKVSVAERVVKDMHLLPCDPFGMDIDTTLTTFNGWVESLKDDLESSLPCDPFGMNLGSTTFTTFGCNLELYSTTCSTGDEVDVAKGEDQSSAKMNFGPPHDGLLFALNYLGVKDLLRVERVCKSLRDAVRYDPLLWKRICIDNPLSMNIDDDALVQLTDRAQGALECLVLVECRKITDIGLGHVLQRNR